jgi:cytochrome c556
MKRIFLFSLLLSLPALAADNAGSVVKYRQSVMKAMGSHMTAIKLVVKGEVGDRSQLAAHAEALHGMSAGLAKFFPRGTGPDRVKSAAKAEIWQHATEFAAAADRLEKESAKLADLARRGDRKAFDAQFAKVGDACGACHDRFRVEDND